MHTNIGVLGSYAKRCRTALGRAGAGQHGEDGNNGAGAGGHVGDGHEKLALAASLTTSLFCSHLRPKAMRVSMARVARAGEGCVPAAQSRRMPERALGLLLTSGGWWVGLGSKAAHRPSHFGPTHGTLGYRFGAVGAEATVPTWNRCVLGVVVQADCALGVGWFVRGWLGQLGLIGRLGLGRLGIIAVGTLAATRRAPSCIFSTGLL